MLSFCRHSFMNSLTTSKASPFSPLQLRRYTLLFASSTLLFGRCTLQFAASTLLFGRYTLLFAASTLLFGRCTLQFAASTLLFGRCTLQFAASTLLFGRYTLLFAASTIKFGRSTMPRGIRPSPIGYPLSFFRYSLGDMPIFFWKIREKYSGSSMPTLGLIWVIFILVWSRYWQAF